MKFAPNIRINYLGDEAASRGLIGVGKSMVPILLNMSSFQNLKNNSFTRNFGDDTVITASHCFDQVTVDIWTRPVDDVVVIPKDDAPISPYSMIIRNATDQSTWGFDGTAWAKITDVIAGSPYIMHYLPTASGRIISNGHNTSYYVPTGIFELLNSEWVNIGPYCISNYGVTPLIENTNTSEIWLGAHNVSALSYVLLALNLSTGVYRNLSSYAYFRVIFSTSYWDRFGGMCWDGSRMWQLWTYLNWSGEVPYWVTFNETEGVIKGSDLPYSGYISPFRRNFDGRTIWVETEVWLSGDPVYTPGVSDPTYGMSYADYPVLANNGINSFRMVDSGPGFAWKPQFWTGTAMWVRNESDNSVWSFDGTDWVKIDDGPGFAWADGAYTEGITI